MGALEQNSLHLCRTISPYQMIKPAAGLALINEADVVSRDDVVGVQWALTKHNSTATADPFQCGQASGIVILTYATF